MIRNIVPRSIVMSESIYYKCTNINYAFRAVCVLLLLTLYSCSVEAPVTSQEYFCYLDKMKNLIDFCVYLLNSDYRFRGQFISRIYYLYFHVARMITAHLDSYYLNSHSETWKKIGKLNLDDDNHLADFGKKMHEYRKMCDYDIYNLDIDDDNKLIEASNFVYNNKDVGTELFNQLKKAHCESNILDDEEKKDTSRIDELINSYKKMQKLYRKKIFGLAKKR